MDGLKKPETWSTAAWARWTSPRLELGDGNPVLDTVRAEVEKRLLLGVGLPCYEISDDEYRTLSEELPPGCAVGPDPETGVRVEVYGHYVIVRPSRRKGGRP